MNYKSDRYYPPEESVIKPLSDLERIINITSPGDFLLFMIAVNNCAKETELNKRFEEREMLPY